MDSPLQFEPHDLSIFPLSLSQSLYFSNILAANILKSLEPEIAPFIYIAHSPISALHAGKMLGVLLVVLCSSFSQYGGGKQSKKNQLQETLQEQTWQ